MTHTPLEAGEKTYVLVVPTVPGESDATNNRLERTVLVTDSKRVRVLYIEGYPRYDFRFVKVLLERESERSVGGKGIEVKVILLNAAKGWEGTDRTALALDAFPTREELFGYDVVVLGDVDPKQLPRGNRRSAGPRRLRPCEGRRVVVPLGRARDAVRVSRHSARRHSSRHTERRNTIARCQRTFARRWLPSKDHAGGPTAPPVPLLAGRSGGREHLESFATAVLVRERVPAEADTPSFSRFTRIDLPTGGAAGENAPARRPDVRGRGPGTVPWVRRYMAVAIPQRRGTLRPVLDSSRSHLVALADSPRRVEGF